MTRRLSTRAELRSAAPALFCEIHELTFNGGVKAEGTRDGAPLYDHDLVLVAAEVRAAEAKLAARGIGIRSHLGHRAEQYRSAQSTK